MFSDFFSLLTGYFKGKTYWPRLEPILTLIFLYILTIVLAYQYVQWQYHFSPPAGVFLKSYIVKQVTVVFITIAVLAIVIGTKPGSDPSKGRWFEIRNWFRTGAKKIALGALILALMGGIFLRLTPNAVSEIKVTFLGEPKTFNKYALVYIIYEINRSQSNWHLNVNYDTFDPDLLTSGERNRCGVDNLCFANMLANNEPFIGITSAELGQDSFWQNLGMVSVISVYDWELYAPPSLYEYLTYSLIVNSTMIHLNRNCHGLPTGSFQQGRLAYGDLFEFSPRRNEMKAAILAAHLSPRGQELLGNCFGLEYMNQCNQLLSLDWLRSGRVKENLERNFGAKL